MFSRFSFVAVPLLTPFSTVTGESSLPMIVGAAAARTSSLSSLPLSRGGAGALGGLAGEGAGR